MPVEKMPFELDLVSPELLQRKFRKIHNIWGLFLIFNADVFLNLFLQFFSNILHFHQKLTQQNGAILFFSFSILTIEMVSSVSFERFSCILLRQFSDNDNNDDVDLDLLPIFLACRHLCCSRDCSWHCWHVGHHSGVDRRVSIFSSTKSVNTIWCVPFIAAPRPRKLRREGRKHVKQGPAQDNNVIYVQKLDDYHTGPSNTCKNNNISCYVNFGSIRDNDSLFPSPWA